MDRVLAVRKQVLEACRPLGDPERLGLEAARGRFLAEHLFARRAVPFETCSAMDGFAVRAAGVAPGQRLLVRATTFAGQPAAGELGRDEAVRVLTGAPLPPGADAVVRDELAKREGDAVFFASAPGAGENVRQRGEDIPEGELALPAGTRLGTRQLALCAATGATSVLVGRSPAVALVVTGDEVASGLLPDSNGVALRATLSSLGARVSARKVPDDLDLLTRTLEEELSRADLLVTVGGASVGDRDHVPDALVACGAELRVRGVPMKPGKPFLHAVARGIPVLGLPGSPSACLVAFEVFGRPAVERLMGSTRVPGLWTQARLACSIDGRAGRARFLWSRLDPDGRVTPLGRDVAQVRGPALANALVCLPSKREAVAAGEWVDILVLEDS
jgi:molybdopterin molybdotransferase